MISGGGTGGHIYPAIAIADELKRRNSLYNFLFVGAKDRMEMEKVPQAGYQIEGLWISGIDRKLSLKNFLFPFKLLSSLWKAHKIIKKFKPSLVVGTGGFASGPTLQMANRKGILTLVQEQNSYPGITNRLLGKKADRICVAYEGLERFFEKEKIIITGNPVRKDLLGAGLSKDEARGHFDLNANTQTLLVIGGSLGARAINKLMAAQIARLVEKGVQVIWQTGKLYFDEYRVFNEEPGVKTLKFIDRMDLAYQAADIIISRAGAGSISELCIAGKPVIFIPSPNVAEDHQTKNAMAITEMDAAILIGEKQLGLFEKELDTLLTDKGKREKLASNIKKLARPNATSAIVDEIENMIDK